MEQEITTPPIIEPEQCERRAIVRQRLLDGKGLLRLRSGTQRVRDSSFPIITARKVKGQLSEPVHVLCCFFLFIALLKKVPNESMQPPTARRTDFGREAFTDLVMAEAEASLSVGLHEMSACRLQETFFNRFALVLLDGSKQRGIKGAPNDRGHPQVIDTLGGESCEALAESTDNTGREGLFQRGNGDPLLVFQDEGSRFDPPVKEFLSKEGITFTLRVEE